MSDQPASSALLALSTELATLVRDGASSLVTVQSARARSTGFSWRPGLIVAAEDALPDDGELSIVAHDGASGSAQIVGRASATCRLSVHKGGASAEASSMRASNST